MMKQLLLLNVKPILQYVKCNVVVQYEFRYWQADNFSFSHLNPHSVESVICEIIEIKLFISRSNC